MLNIARDLPRERFLWFRGHARENYSLIPSIMREGKSAEEIFDREERLLTRFRQRSLAYWPEGYPQNHWEHLFVMQHYGFPTRLLDWSENLFVAMHFALTGENIQADSPPTLWCLDPIEWNRSTPVLSEYGDTIQVLTTTSEEAEAYRPTTNKKRDLPLNFHPAATGAWLVFTPIGAG
ncbi:FRG domain-containing protein [uncultured Roseibium sp.]|uniref:FRG domain-containing protein n=1 Tax=uncultured Roseibium sp. TaxID=1936171 RepID=UPI00374CEF7F